MDRIGQALREILGGAAPASRTRPAPPRPARVPYEQFLHALARGYAETDGKVRARIVQEARQLGRPGVDALIAHLYCDDGDLWSPVADLLADIGDRRAAKPLVRALFAPYSYYGSHQRVPRALDRLDPAWRTTKAAQQMAGMMRQALATGEVPEGLADHPAAREHARRLGDARKAPGEWVRSFTEHYLRGREEGQRTIDLLAGPEALIRERFAAPVRASAAWVLEQLRDKQAVEPLQKVLMEATSLEEKIPALARDPVLAACDALRAIDPTWSRQPDAAGWLDRHIGWLDSKNPALRTLAADVLGRAGNPRAVKPLLAAFDKADPYGSADNTPLLEGFAVWHGDLSDRRHRLGAAAMALVRIGDPSCLSSLLSHLDRATPQAPMAAVLAGRLGRDRAVEPLGRLLKRRPLPTSGPAEDTRHAAVLRRGAGIGLVLTRCPAAIRVLLEAAEAGVPEMGKLAAWALGEYGQKDQALAPLTKLSRDGDSLARQRAIWALGRLRPEGAAAPLVDALRDVSDDVRMQAASALADLGGDQAVEALLGVLAERNVEDEMLLPAAEDDRWGSSYYRRHRRDREFDDVAAALGHAGSPRAIGPLVLALNGGMRSAAPALAAIDPFWPRTAEARQAVPALLAELRAATGRELTPPVALLSAIGDPRAAGPLMEKMGESYAQDTVLKGLDRVDRAWRTSARAKARVGDLIRILLDAPPVAPDRADPDDPVGQAERQARRRAEAAFFLGEIGDRRAVEPLLKVFTAPAGDPVRPDRFGMRRVSPDILVHGACAIALGKIKDPRAFEPLVAVLKPFETLADPQAPGPRTRPASREAGADEPPLIGRRAGHDTTAGPDPRSLPMYAPAVAEALGRLGDRRAVGPLLGLLALSPEFWQERAGRREWMETCPGGADLEPAVIDALAGLGGLRAVAGLTGALSVEPLRDLAAKALGRVGDPKAVAPLVASLGAGTGAASEAVFEVLDQLDPAWPKSVAAEDVVSSLVTQLATPGSRLRQQLPQPDRYGHYRDGLPDGLIVLDRIDPNWRRSDLGRALCSRVRRQLRTSSDPEVIREAMNVLAQFGKADLLADVLDAITRAGTEDFPTARARLESLDPNWASAPASRQAVPRLVQALAGARTESIRNYDAREHYLCLARLLARIATSEALSALHKELALNVERKVKNDRSDGRELPEFAYRWDRQDDREMYVQGLTEVVAGICDDQAVARYAAQLRQSPPPKGQQEAMFVLMEIPAARKAALLLPMLVDPDPHRRTVAWYAMGGGRWNLTKDIKLPPQTVKELSAVLSAGLTSEAVDVRACALAALGAIGAKDAVPQIIPLILDKSDSVASAALNAATRLQRDWAGTPAGKKLLPGISARLRRGEPEGGRQMLALLERFPPEVLVEPLLVALKASAPEIREMAAKMVYEGSDLSGRPRAAVRDARLVEPLVAMLKDEDTGLRAAAARALGAVGDARAVAPLSGLLSSDQAEVVAPVAEALGAIGDPRAVDGLLKALARHWTVLAKSVPARDQARRRTSRRALAGIIRALADLADPRAEAALREARDDRELVNDSALARTIRSALQAIEEAKKAHRKEDVAPAPK